MPRRTISIPRWMERDIARIARLDHESDWNKAAVGLLGCALAIDMVYENPELSRRIASPEQAETLSGIRDALLEAFPLEDEPLNEPSIMERLAFLHARIEKDDAGA